MPTAIQVRSAIRRLPLPAAEPPFDDERHSPPPPRSQGALALVFGLPSGLPAIPEAPAQLRLVTEPIPAPLTEPTDAATAPQPTRRVDLPDPKRWTARLAQALSEVLCAQRPAQQLLRWSTEEVYEALVDRVRPVNRRPSTERMSGLRPHVRALRVCEPRDGVVEASVVVQQGGRYRALALRLEGLDGRWQCTHLEII